MSRRRRVSEQGIAHILIIVLIVAVFGVIGIVGWRIMIRNNGPKSSDVIAGSGGTCMKTYNDSRLCQFATHYTPLNKVPYQATISVTSPQGTLSSLVLNSDGKGNTSLTGSSNSQQLSTIDLNGATYIKTSGSGWIEYPAGAMNTPAQTDPIANLDLTFDSANLQFQYVSTAACGSLTCYKYQISNNTLPSTTQYIWFDTASSQLRRWAYQGSTGETDMTVSYQPVSITAPSPVQVISEPK